MEVRCVPRELSCNSFFDRDPRVDLSTLLVPFASSSATFPPFGARNTLAFLDIQFSSSIQHLPHIAVIATIENLCRTRIPHPQPYQSTLIWPLPGACLRFVRYSTSTPLPCIFPETKRGFPLQSPEFKPARLCSFCQHVSLLQILCMAMRREIQLSKLGSGLGRDSSAASVCGLQKRNRQSSNRRRAFY